MKNELMKENYKIEDMLIRELPKHNEHFGLSYNLREEVIYDIEASLTEDEKLEIFDSHTDGLGSYLLELIKKYEHDKEEGIIKVTSSCSLHRGSVASWMKKNDPRKALYQGYPENYPTYYVYGEKFRMNLITPNTDFGYKMTWDNTSVINQWFHILLKSLNKEENKFFKENDEDQINLTQLVELFNKFRDFLTYEEFKSLCDIIDNREVSEPKVVKFYLNKLKEIDIQVTEALKVIRG